ncbi:putative phosphatidylinositol 4-kinase pik1alpha protein [Rosellinia necatrix]|uniref:Putative phosphatidylinositol 4-kinase pik1alpha protein n=1 Tax=Rosellinia necatrix TaxID=77044 RepID=A0A1W2TMT6_ROSNE|nr:putative phosphatidylinositol 4-kinase pik1alpha protein [Rosellinia necatrix]
MGSPSPLRSHAPSPQDNSLCADDDRRDDSSSLFVRPSLLHDVEQEPEVREWTQFELDTICSLICKHEHLEGAEPKGKARGHSGGANKKGADGHSDDWALRFTTKLNEALNGPRGHAHDIPVSDVREVMEFIETQNNAVMMYIKAQPNPFRITRSKKYSFQRLCSNFNKAFRKWVVVHRQEHRDPNDEGVPQLDWVERYLARQTKHASDKSLLGATRVLKSAKAFENSERGWVSHSVYSRRGVEGPNHSITPSEPAKKVELPRHHTLPAKPAFTAHHQNHNHSQIRWNPYLPRRPSNRPRMQYGQVSARLPVPNVSNIQGMAANMNTHMGHNVPHHRSNTSARVLAPQVSSVKAYPLASFYPPVSSCPSPIAPPPPNTPYPPASPAYFSYSNLRQSIHPTGPRPHTPRGPLAAMPLSPMHLAPALPMNAPNAGYSHPAMPQQNNIGFNRTSGTPFSPSSPMFTPHIGAMNPAPFDPSWEGPRFPNGSRFERYREGP